jgi:hypothetical protein
MTVTATPRFSVSDNDPVSTGLIDAQRGAQPGIAPPASDSNIKSSSVSDGTFTLGTAAAAPISGTASRAAGAAPVRAFEIAKEAATTAPQTADAQKAGPVGGDGISNNTPSQDSGNDARITANLNVNLDANLDTFDVVSSLASDFVSSNFVASNTAPNPNAAAKAPASLGANGAANLTASGDSKQSAAAQPVSAAGSQTAAADKKSAAAMQANSAASPGISSSGTSPSVAASAAMQAPEVPSGRDPSAALTAPAPPVAAPAAAASSAEAPPLPAAHQMLDSAPALPPTGAPIAPGSAAEMQMTAQVNAQMHMGVRTDAFGAVEIHTVVQQSQVGITVHSDRDIARWFSSEVPSLESGLSQSHLNLTGVTFDHGRSGVETAAGFSQGQPRQSYSQTSGSSSSGLPGIATLEPETGLEPATVDILPSDRSAGPGANHVSIHV